MPIPAFAIPAIISGVTGAGQLIAGAMSAASNKRPDYQIPSALRQSVALARAQVQDPYAPGYGQAKDNLDLAAANAVYASQQSGNAQIGLGEIVGQTESGLRELQAMNAKDQKGDIQDYRVALAQYAQAQDTQFQMNEFAPYAQRAQESRDVFGAGLENIMGAAQQYGLMSTYQNKRVPGGVPPFSTTGGPYDNLPGPGTSSGAYDNTPGIINTPTPGAPPVPNMEEVIRSLTKMSRNPSGVNPKFDINSILAALAKINF